MGGVTSSLVLRDRIRAARVPRAVPGKTIVLATWNVRELGRSPRSREALRMIGRILGRFSLVSLVELRESLGDLASWAASCLASSSAAAESEVDRASVCELLLEYLDKQ